MTLDLEARLRRDLPRLADLLEANPTVDQDDDAVDRVDVESARHRFRRPVWFAVAACLLAVTGLAGVDGLVSHRARHGSTTSVIANPNPPLDTWAALPSGPLSPREDATSVWTGTEWLIFGGRQGLMVVNDSAAYDPSTNTWRSLAVNPTMHPGAQAVWTGHVVAVLAKGGGWIYDPAADTWTDLPRQPTASWATVVSNDAVWTGQQVVAIGVTDNNGHGELGARGIDPNTRTWGPLVQTGELAPSFDAMGAVAGARWDGSRVQVWLTTGEGWAMTPAQRPGRHCRSSTCPTRTRRPPCRSPAPGPGPTSSPAPPTTPVPSEQLAVFENGAWTLVGDPQPGPPGDAFPQLTMAGSELILLSRQREPEAIDPTTGVIRALDLGADRTGQRQNSDLDRSRVAGVGRARHHTRRRRQPRRRRRAQPPRPPASTPPDADSPRARRTAQEPLNGKRRAARMPTAERHIGRTPERRFGVCRRPRSQPSFMGSTDCDLGCRVFLHRAVVGPHGEFACAGLRAGDWGAPGRVSSASVRKLVFRCPFSSVVRLIVLGW